MTKSEPVPMIGSRIPAVRDPSPGGPRTGKQNTLVPTDKDKWVTGCKVGECIVDRGDLSVMRRLCPPDHTVSGPQQDWGDRVVNREMCTGRYCGVFIDCEDPDFYFGVLEGHNSAGYMAVVIREDNARPLQTKCLMYPPELFNLFLLLNNKDQWSPS